MSEPKFTPGPWGVSPTGKYVRRVQPNYSVCMLSDSVLDDWIANARLIAAAPELYSALRTLVDECSEQGGCDGTDLGCDGCIAVNAGRAALAKAVGP